VPLDATPYPLLLWVAYLRWVKGIVPLPPDRGVEVPEVVLGLEIGEGDILPLVCWGDVDFSRGLPHGETGHDILLRIWISLQINKN
jgi:hypothetical protein